MGGMDVGASDGGDSKKSGPLSHKKKRVGISIRMDADIHDELRRIAYEYRTSIQALVTLRRAGKKAGLI